MDSRKIWQRVWIGVILISSLLIIIHYFSLFGAKSYAGAYLSQISAHFDSKVVPLVDGLYRPFFSKITYCSITTNATIEEWIQQHGYSIVTYNVSGKRMGNGWLAYRCWTELVEKGLLSQETIGVLGINDDQLISPYNLRMLNLSSIWRLKSGDQIFDLKTGMSCVNGSCLRPGRWLWWGKTFLPGYTHAMQELGKRAAKGQHPFKDCHRTLMRLTGDELRMIGGHTTDIYYVPKKYLLQYAILLQPFFKHKSFIEATVTTVLACIEDVNKTQVLTGLNTWDSNRNKRPWIRFQTFKKSTRHLHFYHPVKWSPLVTKHNSTEVSNYTNFLCNMVLPYLHPPDEKPTTQ